MLTRKQIERKAVINLIGFAPAAALQLTFRLGVRWGIFNVQPGTNADLPAGRQVEVLMYKI
jgi:hypothetical protein